MRERLEQIVAGFRMTRDADPRFLPWFVAAIAVAVAAGALIGVLVLSSVVFAVVLAVLFAPLAGMIVLGRRAQRAQLNQIEGQPGAAAAVLDAMRGQWFVSPAIAFSRKNDFVHRVVGKPGVILVGEGSPARVKQLLSQEKRRLNRVTGDVTVHTVVVGEGDKQVSIHDLTMHVSKLPRELKKTEVPKLERKLKPLDREMPVPKGYMPNPGKKQR